MMLLAALFAPAPAALDRIAPPLGIPVHQTSEQVRDDGKTRRAFRIARTLLFAAEPDGYRLTVTLTSAEADADPDERQRYRVANAPLLDRPIVMHLGRAGALLAIDDMDAVWREWTSGLFAAAPDGDDAATDALRNRLTVMTAPQRRAMVGSIADALFAPPAERAVAPPQPVTITSPPPFAGLALTGTTTTSAEADRIRIRTSASGRSPETASAKAASVAITSDRLVDPASGLIQSWVRREMLATRAARLTTTTTTELAW